MAKTADEVQLLKDEIQAWLEKHELTHDTGWRELDRQYEEKHKEFAYPHYLVLWFEGDLYKVFWPLPDLPEDYAWQSERRKEFEAIVQRHGCWFEFEDYTTLCIIDQDK